MKRFYNNNIKDYLKLKHEFNSFDLVKEAEKDRIEILVDCEGIIVFFEKIVIKKLANDFKNPYLLYPLGEYDFLSHVYCDFHLAFKEVGIDLIWIKKLRIEDQNKSEKKKPRMNDYDRRTAFFSASENMGYKPDYIFYHYYSERGFQRLEEAGAKIIRTLNCNKDFMIDTYRKRKSYAILTRAEDFIVERDINILLLEFLNIHYDGNDLNLPFLDQITPGKIITTPKELNFPIINFDGALRALELQNRHQLICAYILSCSVFRKILQFLHISRPKDLNLDTFMRQIAEYARYKSIRTTLEIPEIKDYLNGDPFVKYTMERCLESFSLKKVPDIEQKSFISDTLTNFLIAETLNERISRFCYVIHLGRYIHSYSIEDIPEGCDPIMKILGNIREGIYPFLLNKNLSIVYDYGLSTEDYVEVEVKHRDIQADKVIPIPDGIKYFEEIWMCNEPYELKYVEKFGLPKAFILYILRYFYKISYGKNLRISMEQFKSLFVAVFYHYYKWNHGEECDSDTNPFERNSFLEMDICPNPKCITIYTWFTNIHHTAKYLCGGALNLTEYFPELEDIINGSIYLAFYETLNNTGRHGERFTGEIRTALSASSNKILSRFKKEFETLIE